MACTNVGWIGSILYGAGIGAVQSWGSDMLFNGGEINYKKMALSAAGGALAGLFAGSGAASTILDAQIAHNVMRNTIANSTLSAIAGATAVYHRALLKVIISGGLYLFGYFMGLSVQG